MIRRIKRRTKQRHSAKPTRYVPLAFGGKWIRNEFNGEVRRFDAADAMVYTFSGRRGGKTEVLRRLDTTIPDIIRG